MGIDVEQAAWGVHATVNENMANAARVHAVERGQDVTRLPLFASGGNGPLHGPGLARALGSPSVLVPPAAGVLSALGFLSAPLSIDLVQSAHVRLGDLAADRPRAAGAAAHRGREGADRVRGAGGESSTSTAATCGPSARAPRPRWRCLPRGTTGSRGSRPGSGRRTRGGSAPSRRVTWRSRSSPGGSAPGAVTRRRGCGSLPARAVTRAPAPGGRGSPTTAGSRPRCTTARCCAPARSCTARGCSRSASRPAPPPAARCTIGDDSTALLELAPQGER